MFAWFRVVVVILICIVLDADSSNDCEYKDNAIICYGNLDIMPTLSNNNVTKYNQVCIYLIN